MTDNFLFTRTGRYLGTWPSGSAEWHAARKARLGGSSIAAVLGISPWESPYSLWCQMAGLVASEPETREQARGHYLEPAIAKWFADQHPDWMVFDTGTWTHKERDWQLANPDRLIRYYQPEGGWPVGWYDIEVSALLEIKTDADGSGWGEPGTDEVPLYYRCQAQWYMDALGLPRTYFAVLSSRLQFAEYIVDYDPADAQLLREKATEFLDSLLWGEMPELDAHVATYEAVRRVHPDIEPKLDLDLDDEAAIDFLTALADAETAAAADQAARTRLLNAMGKARRARWRKHTLATRQAKQRGKPFLVAGRKLPDPAALIGAPA
ncbi:lambda-exonuclease family protein [Acrocarpospora sp. B8E8]|uniref:YqaJ viral recombinase family nuclease n=1 Tax=Acrocarpospora sp. B8E8 TaxID=3153572 RepID=UPI00325C49C2